MGAIPGADALMSAADSQAGSGGITGMVCRPSRAAAPVL
jgi:hypothetical protein